MEPFDPDALLELKLRAKQALRKRMRSLRSAHPAETLAAASERIVARLLELEAYRTSQGLALFWPMLERREVDLRELDRHARESGKRVYYPFLEQRAEHAETGLGRVDDPATLAARGQRFAEPPPDAPRAARGDVELLVVPALAVSAEGDRLGYGSGFYDATIPDFRPPATVVVVAYDFQLLGELPSTAADAPADLVVTDRRTLAASRTR